MEPQRVLPSEPLNYQNAMDVAILRPVIAVVMAIPTTTLVTDVTNVIWMVVARLSTSSGFTGGVFSTIFSLVFISGRLISAIFVLIYGYRALRTGQLDALAHACLAFCIACAAVLLLIGFELFSMRGAMGVLELRTYFSILGSLAPAVAPAVAYFALRKLEQAVGRAG